MPRLIGHSQAIDLILTGRPVGGPKALRMGLANRLVPKGTTRAHAVALANAKAVSSPLQCEEEGLRTVIKMLYPPGPHSSTNCAGDFSSD